MFTSTLFVVIIFNLLVWWIIVSRLRILAYNINRSAMLYFTVGMSFQGVHSVLLPFSHLFKTYLPGRIINSAETSCAVISSFFLYKCAISLLEYALSVEDIDRPKENIIAIKLNAILSTFVWQLGMLSFVLLSFFLEFGLAGSISNIITPSSTDIKGSIPLLVARLGTMGYVIAAEITGLYILFQLLRTSYGQRNIVRVRVWGAILALGAHTCHFIFNLTTTIFIFAWGKNLFFTTQVHYIYAQFDTFVLVPLGLSFFIAIGPRWLAEKIDKLASMIELWWCYEHIYWLRNLFIQYYPAVELSINTQLFKSWNPASLLSYRITRYIIECSDAIHFLLQTLPETDRDIILSLKDNENISSEEIEALLIIEALKKKLAIVQFYLTN